MKILAFLGILVAIMSFLGFPGFWEAGIFLVLGLLIFLRALSLNKQIKVFVEKAEKKEKPNDIFIENNDPAEQTTEE